LTLEEYAAHLYWRAIWQAWCLSQIDAAVRVELGTPNVKLLRNVVGTKTSVTMRLPLRPSRSTSLLS
jgi:hypothetical protein